MVFDKYKFRHHGVMSGKMNSVVSSGPVVVVQKEKEEKEEKMYTIDLRLSGEDLELWEILDKRILEAMVKWSQERIKEDEFEMEADVARLFNE